MKTMTLSLGMALLVASTALAARREINETRPAAPEGEVTVEVLAGDIQVEGWEKDEVQITGSYDDEFEDVEIEAEGGDVSISIDVHEGDHQRHDGGVELKLRVPTRSRLSVEAISGDIEVSGLRGEASIEAISGDIDISGELVEIEVECVSGDLNIRTSPALRRADLGTVSGDIEVRGPLREGRLSIEAVNGDITLWVASDSSAQFDVETFSGTIENELGPKAQSTNEHLPSQELHFSIGSGRARVSIESFDGTVRLSREP